MRRPSEARGDAGSLVIEAVAGIGMLALVTASLATVIPAVLDARDRSARHHDVVAVAVDALERASVDLAEETVRGGIGVGIDRTAVDVDRCDGGDAVQLEVRTGDLERPDAREVLLPGMFAPGAAAASGSSVGSGVGAPVILRVHPSVLADVPLTATSVEHALHLTVGSDATCAVADVVAAGRYALGPTVTTPLVGPTHLLLHEHPVHVTVGARTVDRDLVVAPAAHLTADVDASGARPPDGVSTGGLVWTVRGDDARRATPLGATRAVHPGTVTVVISACGRAESTGSSMPVTLGPGESSSVAVPLATVRLEGIGTRTHWTLNASRFTECMDGSTRRPSMWWSGGLHDGMRIALPRGLWQLSLTTPGMPQSPRMLVPAGEPDLVVVMR
jgi:hypothetical protein